MTAIPSTRLVTIFGGSGFIGRHLVRALANDGWRIRIAVRHPNTSHYLKPMGRVGQIQILKTDAADENAVAAAFKGADAVVNLVGLLNPAGGQSLDTAHVKIASAIARAAAAHGVARLVHFSALGASADAPAHYFQTKAKGEDAVRHAFPDVTVMRPSLVFGPEDDFFNRFGWLARLSPVLPLIGGGTTRLQPVYVGDVAKAVMRALNDGATVGKTYELAGAEIMTMKEVMQLVMKETRRKRLLVTVPFGLAMVKGLFLGLLPKPLLTMDQVRMLKTENVTTPGALTLRDLGILPESAEAILPSYLWRFRKEGEFEAAVG